MTKAPSTDIADPNAPRRRRAGNGPRGHRSPGACIAVICSLAALGTLATNIFLPSLPAMAGDLHVSGAAITSTISTFLAVFAVGQLAVGPLADRFGRRIPVLAGLGVFVLGTIWCVFAADLPGLLVGRALQACGACAATVVSRAIAADLFEGEALARAMAWITVATAASPGFSPLLGSALARVFGWRSGFVFVAAFAACALLAYAGLIGETHAPVAARRLSARAIGRGYLALLRDARFVAPARAAGLLMAALFAVFAAAPGVLLGQFGFSPVELGGLFAAIVGVVFGAATAAPRLSAGVGLYRATMIGLGTAAAGGGAMLLAVLLAPGALLPFLGAAALFLAGVGVASPLSSAGALSPFPAQAGVAAALFGSVQMAGAACGAGLAATVSRNPALALALVLGLAGPLAMLSYGRAGRPAAQARGRGDDAGADRPPQ